MYKNTGQFRRELPDSLCILAFEIALGGHRLSLDHFHGDFFILAIAGAFSLFSIAITVAVAAAAALALQQALSPGNHTVAISSGQIDDAGNSGQCQSDLYNNTKNLHERSSFNFVLNSV